MLYVIYLLHIVFEIYLLFILYIIYIIFIIYFIHVSVILYILLVIVVAYLAHIIDIACYICNILKSIKAADVDPKFNIESSYSFTNKVPFWYFEMNIYWYLYISLIVTSFIITNYQKSSLLSFTKTLYWLWQNTVTIWYYTKYSLSLIALVSCYF